MSSSQFERTSTALRVGTIGVIGRPSTGKSSLINRVCGHKVSIVSPIPQTTRTRIRGIVTKKSGQLIFLDTPGLQQSQKKINRRLRKVTLSVATDVEILLIVLDASRSFGEEDHAVIEATMGFSGPRVVAYNKIDLSGGKTNDSTLTKKLNENGLYDFYSISALTGMGTDRLVEKLLSLSPLGELLYPADMYTDQSPEFRVAEIVRETAFENTFEEVPHSLFIEVIDLERHSSVLWARVTIWVERSSQVGIVVGRRGVVITKIRQKSEAQLVNVFGCPVSLNLRVKVKKKWRSDDSLLQKLHLQG